MADGKAGLVMRKRVLVVDDSKVIRKSLEFLLEEAGYEVLVGVDGLDALRVIRGKDCDLVISDINMPNMDGLTFIGNLKQVPRYKFTPVLVLTTESQRHLVEKGKALGATGWIVKPLDSEKVLAVVKKILGD